MAVPSLTTILNLANNVATPQTFPSPMSCSTNAPTASMTVKWRIDINPLAHVESPYSTSNRVCLGLATSRDWEGHIKGWGMY